MKREETNKTGIEVVELNIGSFQKSGTKTAVLRQKVTTLSTYTAAVDNNRQDSLFSEEEFDTEPKTYSRTEKRVVFINVPDNKTVEQVQAAIPSTAVLYKVLSNAPDLSNNHLSAISRGLVTKDQIAESQVVRYPEKDEHGNPHEKAGQLILDDNNHVQYRKIWFSKVPHEDEDNRNGEEYLSDTLRTEKEALLGVTDANVVESTLGQAEDIF